jgi:hypothetical protein
MRVSVMQALPWQTVGSVLMWDRQSMPSSMRGGVAGSREVVGEQGLLRVVGEISWECRGLVVWVIGYVD